MDPGQSLVRSVEPTEGLKKLMELDAVQQNARRKILESVNLPVILRALPTTCGCIEATAALESRQENSAMGFKIHKPRKRLRKASHPDSDASKDHKRRKQQQEADVGIQEALQKKKSFQKFLAILNDGRKALGDKLSAEKGMKAALGQHVVVFHARKEEELRQKKAAEQRERFECLRRSDVEGYLKLAKELKSSRIHDILERSQGCMDKLNARMVRLCREQKEQGTEKGDAEPSSGVEAFGVFSNLIQPKTLSGGILHHYQMEGLKWLASLHSRRLNGILADEMGLGKTVQIIALISYLLEAGSSQGPFLIAAPASVLPNWLKEFQFWAPNIQAVAYAGSPDTREEVFRSRIRPWTRMGTPQGSASGSGLPSVVVTTYEMLMGKKDKGRLSRLSWEYIILDEGHRIKNAKCRLNAELKLYKTRHRLLVTGTPIQNNLEELWSLLNFLLPSIFDSSDDFQSWFSLPLSGGKPCRGKGQGQGERGGTAASSRAASTREEEAFLLSEEEKLLVVSRLHQMLRPLMLRRLKSSVLGALPEKREVLLLCAPSAYQRLLFCHVATLGLQSPQGAEESSLELPARSRRRGSAEEKEREREREREAEMEGWERGRAGEGGGRGSLEALLQVGRPKRLTVSSAVMELRVICNHPFLSKLHTPEAEEYLKELHYRAPPPQLYFGPLPLSSSPGQTTGPRSGCQPGRLSGVPAAGGTPKHSRGAPSSSPSAPALQQLHPSLAFPGVVRAPQSASPGAGSALQGPAAWSALLALASLTRCCGKLEVLDRVLTKLWVGGHRVLIFCTMTKMLDVLEEYLEARAHMFSQHGGTEDQASGGSPLRIGVTGRSVGGTETSGEGTTGVEGCCLPPSQQQQHVSSQEGSNSQKQGVSCQKGVGPQFKQGSHVEGAEGAAGAATATPLVRRLPGKWEYCRLDGTTSKDEREEVIREFNAPGSETFIFLLSIRAGGQGINLQTADTVIFFDTDWNPQVDLQAQARAHRMGQQRDVLVIRLETAGTVEAKVRAAAAQKLGLAHQSVTAGFFDGKTSDKDRRQYLEELLQNKEEGRGEGGLQGEGDVTAKHPTSADITAAIARSEAERAVFEAMDAAPAQDEARPLVASQELRVGSAEE